MKIAILMEGGAEKAFLPFLRAFLTPRLPANMPNLNPVVYHGRIPKEAKLKRIVQTLMSGMKPANAVIALTDVYTGTNDFTTAQDAKNKMNGWVGGIANFFPHVALHDFEAWLLPYWSRILQLAKHNQSPPIGTPETVNHSRPPSRVIAEVFERGACRDSYSKERDVGRVLSGQDLATSIESCPEFKAFVNRILGLCGGDLIL